MICRPGDHQSICRRAIDWLCSGLCAVEPLTLIKHKKYSDLPKLVIIISSIYRKVIVFILLGIVERQWTWLLSQVHCRETCTLPRYIWPSICRKAIDKLFHCDLPKLVIAFILLWSTKTGDRTHTIPRPTKTGDRYCDLSKGDRFYSFLLRDLWNVTRAISRDLYSLLDCDLWFVDTGDRS